MDIVTARLYVRDVIEDDSVPMHRLRTDPQVYYFNGHFGPETENETHKWLIATMFHNQRSDRDSHNCAIVLRSTNQVIGWIGFGFSNEDRKPIGDVGIGYALMPEFWNRGLMSEALSATLNYIFTETMANNALAYCNVDNIGSARVMQKAGMRFVERFPNPNEVAPKKPESFRYRMSRIEWEQGQMGSTEGEHT